jgi:hypothetical protein
MMQEAKEEFEKWVKLDEGNWWQLSLELDEQGNYKDNNTHHRWCGWANAWIHLWFALKMEEEK